jgi:hypothetical protein
MYANKYIIQDEGAITTLFLLFEVSFVTQLIVIWRHVSINLVCFLQGNFFGEVSLAMFHYSKGIDLDSITTA